MVISRPLLSHQLCFNADPNDPSAVPVWADYTALVRRIGENRRGRNYELALSTAAAPPIEWRDPSEILNPVNTGSAQYPLVQPYRQVLSQAMWPNPANGLGSAVNLINTGRWMPNDQLAPDPSFESFANGAAVPWLTAVGATAPLVTTTNPQQGTKSVTWATAASTTRQGASWTVDCIPGTQYTSSAYVRQSAACTQALLVGDQTMAYALFRTVVSSGWGTSDDGKTWTTTGGSASDYSTGNGYGLQSNGTVNVLRHSYLNTGTPDHEVNARVSIPVVPTGASITVRLAARLTDTSNYYEGQILIDTSGRVTASIRRRVAGVGAAVSSDVALSAIHQAEDTWSMRLSAFGPSLALSVWKTALSEPDTPTATGTDTSLSTGNNAGVLSRLESGNTNTLPVVITWDNFVVTGTTSSSTTTTTGSYVRLTNTFTATQPKHTVSLSTVGTAVVATVNLDAIQHELGASASTFTTSGPVIYPFLRNFAERFPREYEAAGFVGKTSTPAVDGFAALNAISISSDYTQAVLNTQPTYFWPLGGGVGTAAALDISGNSGPPLVQFDTVEGPGNVPAFGTPIAIPGDAGATGVSFQPTGGVGNQPDSALAAGRLSTSPGIAFPQAYPSTWSVSMALWVTVPDTADFVSAIAAQASAGGVNVYTIPIGIELSHSGPGTILASAFCEIAGGLAPSATGEFDPDTPALLIGTVTQVVGGNTTVNFYVNGTLADTDTISSASVGTFTTKANFMDVGGWRARLVLDGVVSRVAMWDRALSAAEITTLWQAGTGNPGETTGARLSRHLNSGNYAGETRISSTCTTTLEPPTWSGSIDLLTDGQQLALAEMGTLWVAPDGALVMESRQDRWLRLTSLATFGEDTASGEIPYLEGIVFDNDPTFVFANVQITRNGGSVARGGTQAQIVAAARKFFGRSYAIGADFETDTQAQDYADFVFNTHRAPLLRVSSITIDPSANPALWATALRLEVGQRVTVKRRAKAANAGAGITMSADYFIETVIHHEINMDNWRHRISFLLSPIGVVPGPSFQPWILENATYGVLDSTTILGF